MTHPRSHNQLRHRPRRWSVAANRWRIGTLTIGGAGLVVGCAAPQRTAVTPTSGPAVWVTTPDRGQLVSRITGPSFTPADSADAIEIDASTRFQEIVGFGAALTDASAALIHGLTPAALESVLRMLFDPARGAGLRIVRLTIGASDFSQSHYTYDDVDGGRVDPGLARFSIAPARVDVIPTVRAIQALVPRLAIMATPWSPPAWMKSSGSLYGGTLRRDAYEPFAEYLVRTVEAFGSEGVPIDYLSIQNEPHHEPKDYPGMRLSPAQRAELIAKHIGPRLARIPSTRLLEWDHNWDEPDAPLAVLADTNAARFVSGVAWHCYGGDVAAQSTVHAAHPTKDTFFTECSGGDWAPRWNDNFLWNVRTLIIGTTRNWARAVLLWNLALDTTHGPHRGGCNDCRGVLTIDPATGTVTANEEYYALAHASRFVAPGAVRVASPSPVRGIESVAFRNTDGTRVLIAANPLSTAVTVPVRDGHRQFQLTLPPGAVATSTWH